MRKANRQYSRRSGMAMMLVIPAVAITAILSYAVLANAGIQDQVSSNAQLLAQADAAAESGINCGLYMLQQEVANASIDPITFTNDSQVGGLDESFTIVVASTKSGLNINSTLTATGTVTRDKGAVIKRTVVVNVQLKLSDDFGTDGSPGLMSTGAIGGNVVSGQAAITTNNSTALPVTNIHVLNWCQ